jgi:hypothetical protein
MSGKGREIVAEWKADYYGQGGSFDPGFCVAAPAPDLMRTKARQGERGKCCVRQANSLEGFRRQTFSFADSHWRSIQPERLISLTPMALDP